jgi:hypothetical protein
MYIFSDKGDRIYSAMLNVTPESEHFVRIYGGATKGQEGDSKDYIGVWCTETCCGRADKDVAPTQNYTPGSLNRLRLQYRSAQMIIFRHRQLEFSVKDKTPVLQTGPSALLAPDTLVSRPPSSGSESQSRIWLQSNRRSS